MPIPAFLKNFGARIWEDHFEHTPPPIRYMDIAYVTLERKIPGTEDAYEPVGNFVPELYELANLPEGGLRCQIEERAFMSEFLRSQALSADLFQKELKAKKPELYAKLYRSDDVRKTPFELALIPSERDIDVEIATKKEFKYRRKHGLELPASISKLRVLPDYLEKLSDVGLRAKEYPNAVKLNLRNPHDKATTREKVLHFLSWPAAVLLTVSAAISTAGFGASWLVLLGVVSLYVAKIKGNEFFLFDVAEYLYRDIGWLTARDIPWKGRFSKANALKTVLKLGTIALAAYFAWTVAWTGTFDLPWHLIGVNKTVQGLKIASALFFSTVGALGTIVGLTTVQRYFWNLSFFNTQVDLSPELVQSLSAIAPKARAFGATDKEAKLAAEIVDLRRQLLEKTAKPVTPLATAAQTATPPTPAPTGPDNAANPEARDCCSHRPSQTVH